MSVFAFVFARGGSKGLKDKNIMPLGGKPLLAWSVDVAKSTSRVDKIFVSTDSKKIKKVAEACDAIVIDRPDYLAADDAPEWLAWQHAVEWVERSFGAFDVFVSLPATAPLRDPDDVEMCINEFNSEKDTDVVVTMTESERSPWFNMVKYDDSGFLCTVMSNNNRYTRRQDAPVTYDMTTVCYVTSPGYIKESRSLWEGNVSGVTIPKSRAVDIDTIDDFLFAEFLLSRNGMH